jgi:hypothetical protein
MKREKRQNCADEKLDTIFGMPISSKVLTPEAADEPGLSPPIKQPPLENPSTIYKSTASDGNSSAVLANLSSARPRNLLLRAGINKLKSTQGTE